MIWNILIIIFIKTIYSNIKHYYFSCPIWDILDFILYCYENNINDILPFVSSNNITLEEIVDILKVDAYYGNYTFNTMLLSNEHLIKYNSILNKTSQEVFKQFLNQLWKIY